MKGSLSVLFLLLLLVGSGCSQSESSNTFEEKLCKQIEKNHDGNCEEIIHIDLHSNLVFFRDQSVIVGVKTNSTFSSIETFSGHFDINVLEGREEPLFWIAHNSLEEEFSILMGIATSDVKTVLIESEGSIQPNHIRLNDNVWFWYQTFEKGELNKPHTISAYEKGNKL